MSYSEKEKQALKRYGFSKFNSPKRTPGHPTKSHAVLVKQGDKIRLVRFGQQGVKGAGDNPKTEKEKARRRSYYARHNAQDSSPDRFSARYWSHRTKWIVIGALTFSTFYSLA